MPAINTSGRLSHAYIIGSVSPEAGYNRALELAARAVCSTPVGGKPCGACRDCLKIQKCTHPDVITISRLTDDKGKTKKFISVDQIRELKLDALVAPNEAQRKVYIIREAEKMNIEAQNAALKLLEEPPAAVVFILCADNAGSLLTTVRSRCEEIVCNDSAASFEADIVKLTDRYLSAAAQNNALALAEFCFAAEGIKPQTMADFGVCTAYTINEILCGRKKNPGIGAGELMHIYGLMQKLRQELAVNVSVKLLFGMLMVETLNTGTENRG